MINRNLRKISLVFLGVILIVLIFGTFGTRIGNDKNEVRNKENIVYTTEANEVKDNNEPSVGSIQLPEKTTDNSQQRSPDQNYHKSNISSESENDAGVRKIEEVSQIDPDEIARRQEEEFQKTHTNVDINNNDESDEIKQNETQTPAVVETVEEQRSYEDMIVHYVGNKKSHKYHYSNCPSVEKMKEENKVFASKQELINRGYFPCKRCNP